MSLNAVKPYSVLGLAPGGLKRVNERVNPGEDAIGSVFGLPLRTHQLDLNSIQSLINLYQDPQGTLEQV